jgi:hypothetical protein
MIAVVMLAAPIGAAPRLKDRSEKANAPEKSKRIWFLPWITLTLEEQTVEAPAPPTCVPFWTKAVFE